MSAYHAQFRPNVHPVVYAGSAQAESAAKHELIVHSLLAAAGIVLLLALLFGSGGSLLLILANLPFALVGGVLVFCQLVLLLDL